MLTLLHVLGDDDLGGCERLSLDLAAHYRGIGLPQAVIFFGRAGQGPAWRAFELMQVLPANVRYQGRPVRFVLALSRWIQCCGVKVVLTHGFGMHLLVAIAARLGGARAVLVLVGNPPPGDTRTLRRLRWRSWLARPWVTAELACSHYVRRAMLERYPLPPERVRVLQNWVNIEEIDRRAAASRATRGVAQSPVLLMVARLDPIKDHATVLKAVARLKVAFPALRLRLVGDGPTRPTLEALATELGLLAHIDWCGAREDVPELMGQADLFVFGTTAEEGFGIVLAEAMAAGLPIVCTDSGPCAEVLGEGLAGCLVKAGDPLELSEAIGKLLRDPGLAQDYAAKASVWVRQRYSVEAAADALAEWVGPA